MIQRQRRELKKRMIQNRRK